MPAFDKAGTADCVNGLTAVTYEAIVRVHDFHYAGPTSSYIEEKLSTIMGVEQHLLLRIGDTNFYADQLQVDGSGVSLGKFPEKNKGKLLSLEEWYHVAFTYDLETGIACIYVNGQLQSQTQVAPTVKVINLGLRAIEPGNSSSGTATTLSASSAAIFQRCAYGPSHVRRPTSGATCTTWKTRPRSPNYALIGNSTRGRETSSKTGRSTETMP